MWIVEALLFVFPIINGIPYSAFAGEILDVRILVLCAVAMVCVFISYNVEDIFGRIGA